MIRQRFGVHGLRLFRLLYLHRQLEQKQIAEQAMLPPKVSTLTHSCACCLATSACKCAAYMGDPACQTCPIASCMLLENCSKEVCLGPHCTCTAFVHDVLDHLCCKFGNIFDEGRVTASLPSLVYYNTQGCFHCHNSRLASAVLGLPHMVFCMPHLSVLVHSLSS